MRVVEEVSRESGDGLGRKVLAVLNTDREEADLLSPSPSKSFVRLVCDQLLQKLSCLEEAKGQDPLSYASHVVILFTKAVPKQRLPILHNNMTAGSCIDKNTVS